MKLFLFKAVLKNGASLYDVYSSEHDLYSPKNIESAFKKLSENIDSADESACIEWFEDGEKLEGLIRSWTKRGILGLRH